MGLFKIDYNKPGKGVEKDEPVKPRFILFWQLFGRKFWKLVQLNLLYLLFCLPVVTIGPATAAFTRVLRDMANQQPVFMLSDFWDAFKNNWKQSLVYSLFLAAVAVLLSIAIPFYNAYAQEQNMMFILVALCILLGIFVIFMSYYAFLMIVTLDLKLRAIMKNATIFSILCLKTNLLTLLFTGLLLAVAYLFFPLSIVLILLIIPAMIGFIICFNSYPKIQQYAIDPYLKAQEEGAAEEQAEDSDED